MSSVHLGPGPAAGSIADASGTPDAFVLRSVALFSQFATIADASGTPDAFVRAVQVQDGQAPASAEPSRLIADATRIEAVLGY